MIFMVKGVVLGVVSVSLLEGSIVKMWVVSVGYLGGVVLVG